VFRGHYNIPLARVNAAARFVGVLAGKMKVSRLVERADALNRFMSDRARYDGLSRRPIRGRDGKEEAG